MKLYYSIIACALFSLHFFAQSKYKTESGIIYNVGDTIQLGQPLSHLGWKSIYSERGQQTYTQNKNLIDKEVVIKTIDTINKPASFVFTFYKKDFTVDIDDALRNKELIPQFERSLAKKGFKNKYELLRSIKSLYDEGVLTKEEFETEKKKILNQE